jgi:hypothetical protein
MCKTFLNALIALVFFPCVVYGAEGVTAGFAPGSIWVSSSEPAANETVKIFVVVFNNGSTTVDGTIHIMVNNAQIGTIPVSLTAGSNDIESLPWKAAEGDYTLQAVFQQDTSQSVERLRTEAISVHVAPAKPLSPSAQAVYEAGTVLSTFVASATPVIQHAAHTTYRTTESFRTAGAHYLATASVAQKSSPGKAIVKGFTAQSTSTPARFVANASIAAQSAASGATKVLAAIFRSPALFYPVCASVLFGALSFAARYITRRERY